MTAVGAKGRAEDTTSFGSLSSSKQLETLDSGCSWFTSLFVNHTSSARGEPTNAALYHATVKLMCIFSKLPEDIASLHDHRRRRVEHDFTKNVDGDRGK